MRSSAFGAVSVCLAFSLATSLAQSPAPAPITYKPASANALVNSPKLPSCVGLAVQDGNPAQGPSVLYIKVEKGCVVPWHWHSANERLIILSGSAGPK